MLVLGHPSLRPGAAEGQPHRPVEAGRQVAGVLDGPKELAGPEYHAELRQADPGHRLDEGLAVADRPAREVPEPRARSEGAPGHEDSLLTGNDELDRQARDSGVDRLVLSLGKRSASHVDEPDRSVTAPPVEDLSVTGEGSPKR